MTEINFIDGQALDPTSFGEYNSETGVWQPIAYTGTYGNNGFYLNFSDNSGTTSTTLGKDYSGNGNNWTPNNFSVTAGADNDSLVDVPTPWGTDTGVGGEVRGNYATLNPLDKDSDITLSNGNLDASTSTVAHNMVRSTIAIPSSGKWYAEMSFNQTMTGNPAAAFALIAPTSSLSGHPVSDGNYCVYGSSSTTLNSGATSGATVTGMTSGQIWQFAVDADNGYAWIGLNNAWFNVYTSGATTGDPANGTNPTFTGTMSGLFFGADFVNSSGTINFGQRPFAYTAPSGFAALCTTNLPDPTIVDGSTAFNAVLWTGDGTSSRSFTGWGFAPDFIWMKNRSGTADHALIDIVRGTGAKVLSSNQTYADNDYGLSVTSFDSDGFTGATGSINFSYANTNSGTYVGWGWKAGGTGVANGDGTITSTVSANTTAGFSVVTYTGNGSTGTVGHGLGAAPSMIIVKVRSTTNDWGVGHASIGWNQAGLLNLTNSFGSSSYFNSTAPTSTVFSVGASAVTNTNSATYVAYCFAPVESYSAFGSYQGNGSTDGSFIYTGFRPRYVLMKSSTQASPWQVFDTARDPINVCGYVLLPNSSAAESSFFATVDILSNGFKLRYNGDPNTSGQTYIYAAFAENPFKYSLAR